MMLILNKKKNLNLSSTSFPSLLRLSSLTNGTRNPPPKFQLIKDYFIESCGFSPDKATMLSKFNNFTSHSQPDSVRHFLKHHAGLSDAQINSVINKRYNILSTDTDKIMEPNLIALRRVSSWSSFELQQLIFSDPYVLMYPHAIPRLEYWKSFLNGDTKKLLLAVKRNRGLLSQDIDKGVAQKIKLLQEYGFSETDIETSLVSGCGIFCNTTASVEGMLKRVEELGFPRGSSIFMRSLFVLFHIGHDTFKAKIEVYKKHGWSEKEFFSAFQRNPVLVSLSEENIREKMEFLVGTARCKHSYIVSNPTLLTFSLEKRLMPRLHVMNILSSYNLLERRSMSLYNFMCIPESKFIDRFIHQNMDKAPELHNIYISVCAGQKFTFD